MSRRTTPPMYFGAAKSSKPKKATGVSVDP